MNQATVAKIYSPAEEKINIVSHAIGLVLSLIALALLSTHSWRYGQCQTPIKPDCLRLELGYFIRCLDDLSS